MLCCFVFLAFSMVSHVLYTTCICIVYDCRGFNDVWMVGLLYRVVLNCAFHLVSLSHIHVYAVCVCVCVAQSGTE